MSLVLLEGEKMKRLLSVLSVLFLIASLVSLILSVSLSYLGKVETGFLILQIVIGVCCAAIGVILTLLGAVLSKRS